MKYSDPLYYERHKLILQCPLLWHHKLSATPTPPPPSPAPYLQSKVCIFSTEEQAGLYVKQTTVRVLMIRQVTVPRISIATNVQVTKNTWTNRKAGNV